MTRRQEKARGNGVGGAAHGAWSDLIHEKCAKAVERVLHQTQQVHHDEALDPDNTPFADELARLRASELSELRLLVEALNDRDVIGVTSMATAFWIKKNAATRRRTVLHRLVPTAEQCEAWVAELQAHPTDRTERATELVRGADFAKLCQLTVDVQKDLHHWTAAETARREKREADLQATWSQANDDQLRDELSQFGEHSIATFRENHARIQKHLERLVEEAEEAGRAFEFPLLDRDDWEETAEDAASAAATGLPRRPPTADYLLRLELHTAVDGDTVAGVAEAFGVPPSRITRVNGTRFAAAVDAASLATVGDASAATTGTTVEAGTGAVAPAAVPLPSGTPVLVQRVTELTGIRECIASLTRRIDTIQHHTLPQYRARVIAAKEALWAAEVTKMTAEDSVDTSATASHEGAVREHRSILHTVERDETRLQQTLQQCKAHREALVNGDLRALSHLLEGKHLEAIEGLGSGERVMYTCRDIPPGVSVAQYAAEMGVPESDLLVFTDKTSGVRYAYAPSLVPRVSLTKLDEELRNEIAEWRAKYPAIQRTDLLEQLAALRGGDIATVSSMLTALRRKSQEYEGSLSDAKSASQRLAAAQEEAAAAKAALAQTTGVNDGLKTTLGTVQAMVASRDKQLAEAESRVRTLTAEMAATGGPETTRKLQQQVADLTAELEVLRAEARSAAIGKATAASAETAEARRQAAALEAQIANLDGENAALRDKILKLERALAAATEGKKAADTRIVFTAREVPPGTSVSQVAQDAGVARADVLSFYDPDTKRHLIYLPTVVPKVDPKAQDERLSKEIHDETAANAGRPPIELHDVRAALRAGDCAALAQYYAHLRRQLNAAQRVVADTPAQTDAVVVSTPAEAELLRRQLADAELRVADAREAAREAQAHAAHAVAAATAAGSASAAAPGGESFASGTFGAMQASMASVDLDDDSDVSIEVLRHKIALLREALAKSKRREEEWRRMCEEYQAKDGSDHVAELEAARADLEKRLEAKAKLLENHLEEIDRLKEAVRQAERERQAEMECAVEGRRKLQAERDATVKGLKRQLDELREKCQRQQRLLEEQAGDE